MSDFGGLYDAILNGDQKTSVALTKQALEEGVTLGAENAQADKVENPSVGSS